MGRKDWKKDFIMCKIYKDTACCGCMECYEKPKKYEFKEINISKEINRAKSSERSTVCTDL